MGRAIIKKENHTGVAESFPIIIVLFVHIVFEVASNSWTRFVRKAAVLRDVLFSKVSASVLKVTVQGAEL